tara:strand:- start:400 stop:519 length:120 start_codon:yes stop_codon:yes gene_type:complete
MKQHIASFDFFVETEIKNVVAAERDGVFKEIRRHKLYQI